MRFTQMAAAAALATTLATAPAMAQNFNLPPAFGTVTLNAGFMPDPHNVNLTAGGNIPADRLGPDCAGTIADAPDVRLNYTGGGFPLYLYANSSADVTLVVNLPDGTWLCNDDLNGTDPGVVLSRPASGQYDIWVGVFSGGTAPARLGISEIPPRR
jgi:serine protease Do/protease YdgD